MKFIHFGLRMEIEQQYLDWCEREGIANKPNSLVVFMMKKEWLNEEKIIKDLKESKNELQKHCHRPNNVACHPEQDDMWCRGCDYWYANEPQMKRSGQMTIEEAIQWFEKSPFMHKDHEPFKMAIEALKQQLKVEQNKLQTERSE